MKHLFLTLFAAAATVAAADVPEAATVLDRSVEVTGGKAAYEKRKAEVATGRMEIPAQAIKGTITIYGAPPNLQYSIFNIPGIGKMESGTDGTVFWENSAMQGPRVKKGAEEAMARVNSVFNLPLRWREAFQKARTLGADQVEGQDCWDIELSPAQGPAVTSCYAKESGLLLRTRMTLTSPMGEMPVETLMQDYRETNGIQFPRRLTQKIAGIEMLMILEKVESPEEVDPERFALPGAIRAILPKPETKPVL